MKNVLLFSLFLSFSTFSFSQNPEFSYGPWRFWMEFDIHSESKRELKERQVLKENNVRSREQIRYKKGIPYKTIECFDEEGRVLSITRNAVKVQESHTTFAYGENGKLSQYVVTNNKGEKRVTNYRYNKEGKVLSQITNDQRKGYSASTMGYNDQGKIAFRRIYLKDEENAAKELVYSYYENGELRTTDYFVKGKLKYSWKYDCKPEGELINVKRRDETMLCLSEDIDEEGNRIVWERKFDEKGRLTKVRSVYFSDSLLLTRKRYNGDDQLVYEVNTIYNKERTIAIGTEVYVYPKKGKPYLASKTNYLTDRGVQTVSYDKKGHFTRTSGFLSNEDGIPLKSQKIDGRWSHTYLYHYGENGLKKSEVRIYKNRTHVKEYVYDYF